MTQSELINSILQDRQFSRDYPDFKDYAEFIKGSAYKNWQKYRTFDKSGILDLSELTLAGVTAYIKAVDTYNESFKSGSLENYIRKVVRTAILTSINTSLKLVGGSSTVVNIDAKDLKKLDEDEMNLDTLSNIPSLRDLIIDYKEKQTALFKEDQLLNALSKDAKFNKNFPEFKKYSSFIRNCVYDLYESNKDSAKGNAIKLEELLLLAVIGFMTAVNNFDTKYNVTRDVYIKRWIRNRPKVKVNKILGKTHTSMRANGEPVGYGSSGKLGSAISMSIKGDDDRDLGDKLSNNGFKNTIDEFYSNNFDSQPLDYQDNDKEGLESLEVLLDEYKTINPIGYRIVCMTYGLKEYEGNEMKPREIQSAVKTDPLTIKNSLLNFHDWARIELGL